jgi:hypothetical protein
VVPIFIVAYFFQTRRELLTNPIFFFSLIAIPLAFLTNYAMFSSSEQAYSIYANLIEEKIISSLNLKSFFGSIAPFFALVSIWLPLSLFGLIKFWRENKAMALWYVLLIFPIIAGVYMPFYYLPVMLPMAYFSAFLLLNNEKKQLQIDKFFYFVLGLMILIGILSGSFFYDAMKNAYIDQKDAGIFIASLDNVMIVGEYEPGIFGYKMLLDKRKTGEWPEVGWIITSGKESNLASLISDYHHQDSNIVDGNFARMYFDKTTFRKDTNVTVFDYIVIVSGEDISLDASLMFNRSTIQIFKR